MTRRRRRRSRRTSRWQRSTGTPSAHSRTRAGPRRRAGRVAEAGRDEPLWLPVQAVVAIHEQLVERFGGTHGVLNLGAIEAAVARARNRHGYASAGLAELAAAYLVGLIGSHGFVDGNKRIGVTAMLVFLAQNYTPLHVSQTELYGLAMEVAQGRLDEEQAAAWIRSRLRGGR